MDKPWWSLHKIVDSRAPMEVFQISHLDPEVESFVLVSELKFLGRVGI